MFIGKYIQSKETREKNKYINLLIVFFAIYFNLSSLAVTTRISNINYLIISISIYVLMFFWVLISQRKTTFNLNSMFFFIFACLLIGITMIINQDFNIMNFTILLMILAAFLVSHMISFEVFISNYVKVILFIAVYSLIIMYIVAPFLKSIVYLFPLRYNQTGLAVRDYIFGFHFEDHSVALRRNTGIFREMGVYQHFLNLGLMFYLFYLKENKFSTILIFSITIITTFSTPGIVFLAIILLVYMYENYNNKFMQLFKVILGLFFILLILSKVAPNIFIDLIYSINKILKRGNSYSGRLSAIIANILAWLNSPIIGNGIQKGLMLAEEFYIDQVTMHNTSTTTSFMAMYGIVFTIMMSFPLIMIISKLQVRRISKILLITGLFLSINSQRFIYDQMYYIFVFSYFMHERFHKNSTTLRQGGSKLI